MQTRQIVIVGGGAGGLELATQLGKYYGKHPDLARVTLVDADRTHIWKPRLHEVAAGVLNANADELNYAAHAKQHKFQFVLGRMTDLNRNKQEITLAPLTQDDEIILPSRTLNYDHLVIALGSHTNDFNTKGAREHCIFLDQRQAAEQFHQAFLNIYLKASCQTDTNSQASFNVAIVGAGATGVELAAELHHSAQTLADYGFNGIQPDHVKITIVEASDRVLPVLSPKASAAIQRQLESINVEVLTNEMVTEVTADGLRTQSGHFVPAQLKVWSAGIKAADFLANLDGLETNRINQLAVDDKLQTTRDPHIFALGDCAQCPRPDTEQPVPPRAQAAHQQASLLAKSLRGHLQGAPLKPFIYRDKGSLISLSKSSSVGNIMGNLSSDFTFEGKLARFFYVTLYRLHQLALHGPLTTALMIIRDRLNHHTGPKMKLH